MMAPPSTEAPLLTTTAVTNHRRTRRPRSLRTATRYIRRVSSRILMRELPMRVRESATEHIEQRQTGLAYSWPAIILTLGLNLAFIVASICVVIMSVNETPGVPLRVWIVGHVMQCCVHGVCAGFECKKKWDRVGVLDGQSFEAVRDENLGSGSDAQNIVQDHRDEERSSVAKHLESADTIFSFIWWIIGFYWIFIGGQNLTHDSPLLYWLCITFLVFDVFIVVIYVAVACVVGLAVCFFLPCILAMVYAVADQEGEIKSLIERLPLYKFQRNFEEQNENSQNGEIQEPPSGKMTECNTDTPTEHVLPLEDAVCCICLCAYQDGNVLRRLPCRHHFHSSCIGRWLYLNATCPLCKHNTFEYGIIQSGRNEV